MFVTLVKKSLIAMAFALVMLPTTLAASVTVVENDAQPVASGTVLPATDLNVAECEILVGLIDANSDTAREAIATRGLLRVEGFPFAASNGDYNEDQILGCAVKTGAVRLWMVPFFIRSILQFVIGLAGVAAMVGIVYGGFLYLFAGLSDDKEKGKKAILYGIVGFVMTLTAWAIVNIVIAVVT